MTNINNTNDYLADYLNTVKENKHDDMIKILTAKIENTPCNNTPELIRFLQYRAKAFFQIEKYNMTLKDCIKLESMGYNMKDDEELRLIQVECQYRMDSEKAVKALNDISSKFSNKIAASAARKIEAVDIDKIFKKGDLLQRQGSINKKK